jgi:2-polyprenyl-3-methyl-5-hydroxy-6-metoxy-1,4-benzoquinol methylase
MDELFVLQQHYERYPEGPRLRRSRVRQLEFETTLHVLDKHLRASADVLELGAGHGAYSLRLARQGHRVVASDLLDVHVEAIRRHAREQNLSDVCVRRLDATDLSVLESEAYDAVLCLGPFYHLTSPAERMDCLRECRRVVRPSGVVAVSYVNALLAVVRATRRARSDHEQDPYDFFDIAHLCTPESAAAEIEEAGMQVVEHAGVDGVFGFFPEALEEVDDNAFAEYTVGHRESCSRPSGPAASGHNVVIARAVPDVGRS